MFYVLVWRLQDHRVIMMRRELCCLSMIGVNGCVFDCFQFGNPLNSSSETTDLDLEKSNFQQAMIDMVNIINRQNINNHKVKGIYIKHSRHKDYRDKKIITSLFQYFSTIQEYYKWQSSHVRWSQHSTQFTSCLQPSCKTRNNEPRSQHFKLFEHFKC